MDRLKEEFNKLFTRKSLNPKDKGKYRDDWFIKEGVTSKEVWNWIQKNYISKKEILGLEGFKEEVIDENTTKQAIDIEKINEGNVSAREILEDIGKSFNQRNSLRREIKQQITNLLNKKDEK